MTWDLAIKGGRIVDGTGMSAFVADLGIRDGRRLVPDHHSERGRHHRPPGP